VTRPTFDTCIQVNLQRGFGGGEVYTAAFARALRSAGVATRLFVDPRAKGWDLLSLSGARMEPLRGPGHIVERLRTEPPRWLAFHSVAPAETVEALRAQGHLVTGFAHMPLYGRSPAPLRPCNLVLAVSRYVIASARAAGLERVYPEPLYGAADLAPRGAGGGPLRQRSRYDWDRRKFRDRLLGALEPIAEPLRSRPLYARRPGLTLGVVSRLTPIKQFPELFAVLAPMLARLPQVNLEIFGSGGYASVRDLEQALAPLGDRVRFWGHQADVAAAYRAIDFLLTGLPEKEALGLNVIEAQACGTPVLAPDAPPFDETVAHGVTGLRYRDPRVDAGADFERTLRAILSGGFHFDAQGAPAHLAQFGDEAFARRAAALLAYLRELRP
jgi:glycosyltransferase involved in cell wall biosynthesis